MIGPDTVTVAAEAGVDLVAFEGGKTLLLEKDEVLARCQRLKVTLLALDGAFLG